MILLWSALVIFLALCLFALASTVWSLLDRLHRSQVSFPFLLIFLLKPLQKQRQSGREQRLAS